MRALVLLLALAAQAAVACAAAIESTGAGGAGGSPGSTASSAGGGSTATTGSSSAGGADGGGLKPSRIGVFRPSNATWTLDDGNGSFDGCGVDTCLPAFGGVGDLPVLGDWAGKGKSAIGIFRPSDASWSLDDGDGTWEGCGVDTCVPVFGGAGDLPVAGDWAGKGKSAIGIFRPSDASWSLDDGDATWEGCGVDTCVGPFGGAGDIPVAGDWAGKGKSAIGIFRPSDATWSLDNGNGTWEGCGVDTCAGPFGGAGDIPVVGDWTGTGKAAIGVFRPSDHTWTLDNGNGVFDGCGVDLCLTFGMNGDVPVAGRW